MKGSKTQAKIVLQTKVILSSGVIVELKIWEIRGDPRFPQGFKYSLFAIYNGSVFVGYDNHHPKGHHRHLGDLEASYHFTSLENLKNDFKADLEVQMGKADLK